MNQIPFGKEKIRTDLQSRIVEVVKTSADCFNTHLFEFSYGLAERANDNLLLKEKLVELNFPPFDVNTKLSPLQIEIYQSLKASCRSEHWACDAQCKNCKFGMSISYRVSDLAINYVGVCMPDLLSGYMALLPPENKNFFDMDLLFKTCAEISQMIPQRGPGSIYVESGHEDCSLDRGREFDSKKES